MLISDGQKLVFRDIDLKKDTFLSHKQRKCTKNGAKQLDGSAKYYTQLMYFHAHLNKDGSYLDKERSVRSVDGLALTILA